MMRVLLLLVALTAFAADQYLFTSFRRNGETGVYFALSSDGRTWTDLGQRIKPEHPGELMRDPFLVRGPDGLWHMVWTWDWKGMRIGYANSRDLVTWSPQREITIPMEGRNAWAPEAAWNEARREWIVFWATTVKEGEGHRLWAMTTADWKTFSKPFLWFDPGFSAIDSTIVKDGGRYRMVFKDERENPVKKNLQTAVADSPAGPWGGVTEPFSPAWVEGPSVVRIGDEWWIYFDHYRKPQRYGALRTKDWARFEPVDVTFPADHRHGTVVRISEAEAKRLRD